MWVKMTARSTEEVPEGMQPGQTMRVKLKDDDEDSDPFFSFWRTTKKAPDLEGIQGVFFGGV